MQTIRNIVWILTLSSISFLLPLSTKAYDFADQKPGTYAYDFGDQKSATLATKAWAALEVKDWIGVEAYTEKCISLYTKAALQQQSEITSIPPAAVANTYWALNDVAICYFIKAKALHAQNKLDLAKKNAKVPVDEFSYAQCWDNQGWFWSVASACNDLIATLGTNVDFEDYTSEVLVRKAWESSGSDQLDNAIMYTKKCIALYEKDAKKQQESLTNYALKDQAFNYWALNDVGTAYFILGEVYAKKKQWKESVEAYKACVNEYLYSQCWDPKGWFWKPAVAARGKLNKILAEQGLS
jgi:tetratricopeptide (TPR) repeat protein